MTKYLFSFLIFILLSNSSNGQRLIYDTTLPTQMIRLIPEQTRGGTVSQDIEQIKYIPLISDRRDRIGAIKNMSFLDGRVGIVDQEKGHFQIFNLDGSFVKKVSAVPGYRPQSGILFSSSDVVDGHFSVYTTGDLIVKIDREGAIIDTTHYSRGTDSFDYQINLDDSKIYYRKGFTYNDIEREYALKLNNDILIDYVQRDTVDAAFYLGHMVTEDRKGKAFATFNGQYEIFELDPSGISKIYKFIFPSKNTIDTAEYYNLKGYDEQLKYFSRYPDAIRGIGNVLSHGRYLVFYIGKGYDGLLFALDPITMEVFDLRKILPDKENDYIDFLDPKLIFSDGEHLYSVIYPISIRNARTKAAEEQHEMRKEYSDLERFDNPILVQFKLK